jgi:hypothetical protein
VAAEDAVAIGNFGGEAFSVRGQHAGRANLDARAVFFTQIFVDCDLAHEKTSSFNLPFDSAIAN